MTRVTYVIWGGNEAAKKGCPLPPCPQKFSNNKMRINKIKCRSTPISLVLSAAYGRGGVLKFSAAVRSYVHTHTHTPKQQRNHVFVSVYVYLLPPEAVILRMKVVAHCFLEKNLMRHRDLRGKGGGQGFSSSHAKVS